MSAPSISVELVLRVIDVKQSGPALLCFALLCSLLEFIDSSIYFNNESSTTLAVIIFGGYNETKICSEIGLGINKLQLRPKINENVMTSYMTT